MKILLGERPSLAGTLLYFSGTNMTFQNITVERNPCALSAAGPPAGRETGRAASLRPSRNGG